MEKLSEQLENDLSELIHCLSEIEQERINKAIARFKAYEEADEALRGDERWEWISVDEKLPKPNKRVLVYRPTMEQAGIGPISLEWGWTCKICKRKWDDISHWMPLPEPPEERDE